MMKAYIYFVMSSSTDLLLQHMAFFRSNEFHDEEYPVGGDFRRDQMTFKDNPIRDFQYREIKAIVQRGRGGALTQRGQQAKSQ